MFGVGIYLMRLIDYLQERKYKKCDICNKTVLGKDKLDEHMISEHSINPVE